MPSGTRPLIPRRLLPGLAILLLASGALACTDTEAQPPAPPPEREFRISQDPEAEVLRIQSMTWNKVSYILFADGSLSISNGEERVVQLSESERDALLSRLVEAGVMELNTRDYLQRLRNKRKPYFLTDSSGVRLTIDLEDYSSPSQSGGPARVELVVPDPVFNAQHYEDEDVRALGEVIGRIFSHGRSEPGPKS